MNITAQPEKVYAALYGLNPPVPYESDTPPAERVASGGPPRGGPKLGKVPLSFSLVIEL